MPEKETASEEPNLTDYWNDVDKSGKSAPPEPKILSAGEMLDRIYRSISAFWAIDPPWSGDKLERYQSVLNLHTT